MELNRLELQRKDIIKKIKSKTGFTFTKSLGQNFLTDFQIIDKILEGANISSEDTVIEIGPGNGALTAPLAKIAKKILAIEIDKKLIPILSKNLSGFQNTKIINEDILKVDLHALIGKTNSDSVKVIGNLPYYITTPIIMKILEEYVPVKSITVMVQKEVADRLLAAPSTKEYGALSVVVQYYCDVHHITDVPRTSFYPRPNVDSTVIRLDIAKKSNIAIMSDPIFFKTIKASFAQRRKTLSNSLCTIGLPKDKVLLALLNADINPERRGETLSIEEFAKLSNAFYEFRGVLVVQ